MAKAGRPPILELTNSQKRALDAIIRLTERDAMAPTMAELAEALGVNPASAYELVLQLTKKGRVRRDARKARSLFVISPDSGESVSSREISIPIVGTVAAGVPILATENVVGSTQVDGKAARGVCFALKVNGDSMVNANIRSGDLVIVRQQPIAENGDIVVALVDGEATVKKLFISDDVIQLLPANPKFGPISIHPGLDFRLVGKVIETQHAQKRKK